jgi:hypothetical protein
MDKKAKYDLNYMGGKCPYGFEWVDGYWKNNDTFHGTWIKGYCRKIKKYRFSEPEDW